MMKRKLKVVLYFLVLLCLNMFLLGNANIEVQSAIDVKGDIKCYSSENSEADNAAVEENALILTENYATHYFSNLNRNLGYNIKGSCSYVAMGMLLSYWDTYWNDNIIPENYDEKTDLDTNELTLGLESPGIWNEDFLYNEGVPVTADQYYQLIQTRSNSFFHFKLIQMAQERLGVYDFTDDEYPCGLAHGRWAELLQYYLYSYNRFSFGEVSIITNQTQSKSVREFAISMIRQGIPVILAVAKSNVENSGHAVVAYDYDERTQTIFVHKGFCGGDKHRSLESLGYDILDYAMAIGFRTNHSNCTDNFEYRAPNQSTIITHCPCELEIHGARRKINYNNLTFGNQTASVIVDNHISQLAPTSYRPRYGLDLSNITAYISATGTYDPRMIFLGWYSDAALTNPITSIPTTATTNINLYAKWRYDYTTVERIGTYIINGSDCQTQEYDQINIVTLKNQISNLKALGMEYLTLKVKINMWENTGIDPQSQSVHIFDGYSSTANQLGAQVITTATQTPGVQEIRFYIDLDDLVGLNFIYIRYASSSPQASWSTDRMYTEMMCVRNVTDVNAPDFYFSDDDPFV